MVTWATEGVASDFKGMKKTSGKIKGLNGRKAYSRNVRAYVCGRRLGSYVVVHIRTLLRVLGNICASRVCRYNINLNVYIHTDTHKHTQ